MVAPAAARLACVPLSVVLSRVVLVALATAARAVPSVGVVWPVTTDVIGEPSCTPRLRRGRMHCRGS